MDLVNATRTAPGVLLGAIPRASLSLMKTAKAIAMFDDLEFVTPDHIQEIAVPVIDHRMVMEPQARFSVPDRRRDRGRYLEEYFITGLIGTILYS